MVQVLALGGCSILRIRCILSPLGYAWPRCLRGSCCQRLLQHRLQGSCPQRRRMHRRRGTCHLQRVWHRPRGIVTAAAAGRGRHCLRGHVASACFGTSSKGLVSGGDGRACTTGHVACGVVVTGFEGLVTCGRRPTVWSALSAPRVWSPIASCTGTEGRVTCGDAGTDTVGIVTCGDSGTNFVGGGRCCGSSHCDASRAACTRLSQRAPRVVHACGVIVLTSKCLGSVGNATVQFCH